MNQQLVAKYLDHFDEGAIEARSEELTRYILTVWPGPPDHDVQPVDQP
jgi:hypothetical protein